MKNHDLITGTFDELYEKEYIQLLARVEIAKNFDEALFWMFVKERMAAWARRSEGLSAPWTGDPIINEWRFTNIYRELDRGTLFLADNILEKCTNQKSAFFMSAFYRCFNRPETWELFLEYMQDDCLDELYLKIIANNFEDIYAFFNKYHSDKSIPLFTGAYQMTSMVKMFYEKRLHELKVASRESEELTNIEYITRKFTNVSYLGMFSAFQIAMDLCIPAIANKNKPCASVKEDALDSWFTPGPGSKAGAALIFPNLNANTTIRYLRETQFTGMIMLGGGITAYPIKNEKPQYLRMIDIEHALCEYAKYYSALRSGRMKSKYSTKSKPTKWICKSPIPKSWGNAYDRTR